MNPLNQNNQGQGVNFGQLYSQAVQNPSEFLSKLGIPKDITTPQGAVQYLLQSGKITQTQIDQAQKMAAQIQKNNSL